jgi:hypothetical protein
MAPLDMVVEPAVIVELREHLLVWERELDERENTLMAIKHGVVEAERALGRACLECDAILDRVGAVQ